MVLFVPFPDRDRLIEVYFDDETGAEPELIGTIKDGVFFVDRNPLTANDLRKIAQAIDLQNGETRCSECGAFAVMGDDQLSRIMYRCFFGHDTVVIMGGRV